MKRLLLVSIAFIGLCVCLTSHVNAQGVGVNSSGNPPNSSAGLDVDFNNKGFLQPRLTSAQRDAIPNPAPGLRIYNSDSGCENFFNGNTNTWQEICGTCVPATQVTSSPTNQTLCTNSSCTFTVAASGSNLTYQWQVSTNGGSTWTNLSNGSPYSGVTSTSLTLTNPSTSLSGNLYKAIVTGACAPAVASATASLTVNPLPTVANAGTDQLNVPGTSATLAANTPVNGSGLWTIQSGSGGNIVTPTSPTSTFTGLSGQSYTLLWTVSNTCGSSSDDVVISFSSSLCGNYASYELMRQITISNANATTLTNFEVPVVIDHASLVSAGKAKADGSDFLVTDNTCTALNFWTDPATINTASCTTWVQVPNIPSTGSATIYLLYKNPGATSLSNGPNTFVYFNDFNNGISGYTIVSGGGSAWVSANNTLRDNGVSTSVVTGPNFTPLADYIWEFTFQTPNPNALDCQVGLFDSGSNGIAAWLLDNGNISMMYKTQLVRIPDGSQFSSFAWGFNTSIQKFYMQKIGNNYTFKLNNNTTTVTSSGGPSTVQKVAGFGSSGSNRQMNYDDMRVRHTATSFPTVSVGTEQNN